MSCVHDEVGNLNSIKVLSNGSSGFCSSPEIRCSILRICVTPKATTVTIAAVQTAINPYVIQKNFRISDCHASCSARSSSFASASTCISDCNASFPERTPSPISTRCACISDCNASRSARSSSFASESSCISDCHDSCPERTSSRMSLLTLRLMADSPRPMMMSTRKTAKQRVATFFAFPSRPSISLFSESNMNIFPMNAAIENEALMIISGPTRYRRNPDRPPVSRSRATPAAPAPRPGRASVGPRLRR